MENSNKWHFINVIGEEVFKFNIYDSNDKFVASIISPDLDQARAMAQLICEEHNKNKIEISCWGCKFSTLPADDEPCNSCNQSYSNFQAYYEHLNMQ